MLCLDVVIMIEQPIWKKQLLLKFWNTQHLRKIILNIIPKQTKKQKNDRRKITKYQEATALNKKIARLGFSNSKRIMKAACCNLLKVFKTNANSRRSFNAVTGTKQLKMPWFNSQNTRVLTKNFYQLGDASAYGLISFLVVWVWGPN